MSLSQRVRFSQGTAAELHFSRRIQVKPLRLACVGLGRMGCIRSEAIATHPKAQLAWVVDLDEGRRSEFSARFAAKGSSNAADALSDESVDAVWIAAPTDAHEDLIKEALANGKAVGVEKPVCNSPVAAASCYDAAESAGLPLFCSFQRRFDPTYQDVATHVASGAIGTVKKVRKAWQATCPERTAHAGRCRFTQCFGTTPARTLTSSSEAVIPSTIFLSTT
eukprot:scaffold47_cov258-Pinguiococcus_pyrenoidosus.AAC.42